MKCVNCGGNSFINISNAKGRKIILCNKCDLAMVGMVPSKRDVIKTVNKVGESFYSHYLTEKNSYDEYFTRRIKEISIYKSKGNLLEIGSGPGLFLQIAKKYGWMTTGIELSKEAVRLNRKHGIDVRYGTLETAKIGKKKYDVICAFQVIEHVRNPLLLLKQMTKKIEKDGIIMIVTPNRKGLSATLSGRFWYDYYNREHLYFFSTKSLENLVKRSGFKLLYSGKENSRKISIYYQWKRMINYYYTPGTKMYSFLLKSEPFVKLIDKFVSIREPFVNLKIVAKLN